MSRTSADSQGRRLPVAAAGFSRVPVHAPLMIRAGFSRVQGSRWVLNPLLSHPSHHQSPQCFHFFFSRKGTASSRPCLLWRSQIPSRYLKMGRAARRLNPRENRGCDQEQTRHHKHVFPFFCPWLLNGFPFPHARAEAERSAHFVLPRLALCSLGTTTSLLLTLSLVAQLDAIV